MFNRTRVYANLEPGLATWISEYREHREPINPSLCIPRDDLVTNTGERILYPNEFSSGEISDRVFSPPSAKRYAVPRLSTRFPRPVKPVHHLKRKLVPKHEDLTFVEEISATHGWCIDSISKSDTTSGLNWLCRRFGYDYVVENYLNAVAADLSAESFTGADWFSLADKFNEECDNLVPASFFFGESFAEGGIFIDAIRAVTNPSKFVIGLLTNIRRRKLTRMSLGDINRYYLNLTSSKKFYTSLEARELAHDLDITASYLKEGINVNLLYKFGVKPAIHDIRDTITSHSTVNEKLAFLNKHAGQYVPIRVRQRTQSVVTDYGALTFNLHIGMQKRNKYSVSTLYGQGRVRADINEANKYRAYAEYFGLNKIVGTAWELIPFSFVVDWFTNAQERINDLTRIHLGDGPFMNLTSIGSSVKNVVSWDVVLYPGYDISTGLYMTMPNSPTPLFSLEVSEYNRSPGIPDTSGVVDMSALGLFHWVTGAELLIQRFL